MSFWGPYLIKGMVSVQKSRPTDTQKKEIAAHAFLEITLNINSESNMNVA